MGEHGLLTALLAVLQASSVSVALYAAATAAGERFRWPAWCALAAGAALVSVGGTVQFWAMALTPDSGAWLRAVWAALAAMALVQVARRRSVLDRELLVPCAAPAAGMLVLLCALYVDRLAGAPGWPNPLSMAAQRWTHPLPGDNEIPFYFAEFIRLGQMASPFYGDWLSSDRPPLQTGLYLLFSVGDRNLFTYQAISVALQMLCLPAVWAMARAFGASQRHALLAGVAALASPLVIVHGGFVWPKLLAAACLAFAVVTQFAPDRPRNHDALLGAIAGVCGAAAMLSHGASAFAGVGVALAALLLRRVHGMRYVATAVLAFGVAYGPWAAYQRLYDPPGDRLMRWHLAGVIRIDSRPFAQTIAEEYGKLTLADWGRGRLRNVATMLNPPIDAVKEFATSEGSRHDRIMQLRATTFFQTTTSLHAFLVLLYALPALLWWRRTRALALAATLSLASWALLIFSPGETIPHQGSMFPQLALFAIAALLAGASPLAGRLFAGLVVIQVLLGLFFYGIS